MDASNLSLSMPKAPRVPQSGTSAVEDFENEK
jgi:hypothetical protein